MPSVAPAPIRVFGMSAIGSQLGGPLAGSHMLAAQNPVRQSLGPVHANPTAHAGHAPPQSMSVSPASRTPFAQPAASASPITAVVLAWSPAMISAVAVVTIRRPSASVASSVIVADPDTSGNRITNAPGNEGVVPSGGSANSAFGSTVANATFASSVLTLTPGAAEIAIDTDVPGTASPLVPLNPKRPHPATA